MINCKTELSLNWIKNCVFNSPANAGSATFKKTDAKLYVLIVTLSTEDNAKLTKQLREGFKRPVYWNKYKVIDNKLVQIIDAIAKKKRKINKIKELLDSSYQEVKRLFCFCLW